MHNDAQSPSIQENTEYVVKVAGPPLQLFALIIGINNYASSNYANLGGAVTDAKEMEQYLRKTLHVSEKHIHTLYDHDATREAIIKAFRELQDDLRIERGDPIVIFYAGHGGELTPPTTWSTKKKIECLIPHDCEASDFGPIPGHEPIPDRTISALIEDIAEVKGNNITVIFDCCHSGSGTRDPEYVPRSVTLKLNISETLDENIWGSRVGTIHSGFAYHGSPRSHVLLAACGENELAYEHKRERRGQFTIALLKALENYTINNELAHVTYVKLIERTLLKHPLVQHPQCEGINRHRPLFGGRVTADWDVFYPATCKGGKCVISAGLAQAVARGVEFTLYDDRRQRRLGIVPVDETSIIEDFKTTIPTSVQPTGVSFAKLTRVGELPLYVDPENLPSFLVTLGCTDPSSTNVDAFRLVKAEEAKLEAAVENDLIVLKVLDQRVRQFGLAELPKKVTLSSINYVLRFAAYYYWFLDFAKENDRISTQHDVAVDFYLLNIDYDDYCEPTFSLIGPGLCRQNPNSNCPDVIDFIVDPDAFYGIKLTNNTQLDLYPNVFIFNNGSFSIVPYYTQSTSGKAEAPLKRGGTFTIGCEPGTTPLSFALEEGQDVDVGYLKIFFATRPIDLSNIAQSSAFSNPGARVWPDDDTEGENKWAVFKVIARFLSLMQKPDTVDTWFTLVVPVVQRRGVAA